MNVGNFTTFQPLVTGKKAALSQQLECTDSCAGSEEQNWDGELHLVVRGPGLMVRRTGLCSQLCLLDDHRHLSSPVCAMLPSPLKHILFLWKGVWDAAGKQAQEQMSS